MPDFCLLPVVDRGGVICYVSFQPSQAISTNMWHLDFETGRHLVAVNQSILAVSGSPIEPCRGKQHSAVRPLNASTSSA